MAAITYTNWSEVQPPAWMGDFGNREHLIPGGAKLDPAQFLATDAVVVTVGAAGAIATATSVPVDALSGPLPSGTVLNFGTNKFARLTAAAAAAATAITVAAIPTALVDNDTATYAGILTKLVPSGTFLGRTIVERDAGTGYGPWTTGDAEEYLLALDVTDAAVLPDVELYRHGGIVKDNFLPAISLVVATLARIRALYACTKGAN